MNTVSDRYVDPNAERGGWDVAENDDERASAHTDTKAEAIGRAREIVRGPGGGEVRIADPCGPSIDSDTHKGPRRGESRAGYRK